MQAGCNNRKEKRQHGPHNHFFRKQSRLRFERRRLRFNRLLVLEDAQVPGVDVVHDVAFVALHPRLDHSLGDIEIQRHERLVGKHRPLGFLQMPGAAGRSHGILEQELS